MSSARHVSWFEEVGLADRPHVGGKGGSLGELRRAGIAVPPGFVIRTAAFERFIEALERESPVRAEVEALDCEDLDAVQHCARALRARLENASLPAELRDEIASAHESLRRDAGGGAAVAVRSSATTEDAADASFAGLQDTYLWVLGAEEMLHRVRSCWASLYSAESITYRRKHRFPESSVAMAVVVQRMVNARTAGVMFTRSPTTGDRSVVTIEGAWGLGSAVVGGEVTPDRWVVGKITGEISVREISDKAIRHVPAVIEMPTRAAEGHGETSALNGDSRHGGGIQTVPVPDELRRAPSLSDEEIQALRTIARNVERHYGRPQDIEWAIDHGTGEVLLLQSRPETVWSVQESAPAARPADNPLSHVMSIFGGRR
ncbi:MAG TPA: PEP/pyruvate-binding domain-containing protein [Steroidobacteraceae bacterium]|nr:PEP/pyruvate-binding domain-containing protein [Steroidobacteraceae bacterium]